ncbi:MAG: hypothetical protein KM296_00200 [Brockia lithotrophica]|nr:hypothetical protein [Brockia lithotrophica]
MEEAFIPHNTGRRARFVGKFGLDDSQRVIVAVYGVFILIMFSIIPNIEITGNWILDSLMNKFYLILSIPVFYFLVLSREKRTKLPRWKYYLIQRRYKKGGIVYRTALR